MVIMKFNQMANVLTKSWAIVCESQQFNIKGEEKLKLYKGNLQSPLKSWYLGDSWEKGKDSAIYGIINLDSSYNDFEPLAITKDKRGLILLDKENNVYFKIEFISPRLYKKMTKIGESHGSIPVIVFPKIYDKQQFLEDSKSNLLLLLED